VIFERSSHMPYVEEPEAFLDTVESFLRKVRLKTGLGAR
jgi:pimeloyl-ACP methyl ester carboxylesterase